MKRRKIFSCTLLLLSLGLLTAGSALLLRQHFHRTKLEREDAAEVRDFENTVSGNAEQNNKNPEKPDNPDDTDLIETDADAVGVLYIPSFDDFSHLLAYGVDGATLNHYVGIYTTFAEIGEKGNCVLAAHSNELPGKQPYCYFNRIEDSVRRGDEIQILLRNGSTCTYQITGIYTWIPAEEEQPYLLFDTGNERYLTLQTCTHGNGRYRTFIRAIQKEGDL